MSLYKLNELSNELELKEKIKDARKRNWLIAQAEHDRGRFNVDNTFKKMKDYDRRNHHDHSDPEYKKLRIDVNNGITLCKECHKEFHDKYGFYPVCVPVYELTAWSMSKENFNIKENE